MTFTVGWNNLSFLVTSFSDPLLQEFRLTESIYLSVTVSVCNVLPLCYIRVGVHRVMEMILLKPNVMVGQD